ncbi:acetylcholinesterase-like [Gigantopelta aegis]|uniref:acetylcholinesterase-like n=1 Tax=Gigantopelta aegis TaxID=1735272 RepID=UPI001B889668|nr:acetylcholinesterase-like [Gigantopelta aegis]
MLPHSVVSWTVCVALTGTIVTCDPQEFTVRETVFGKIRGYVHSVLENNSTVERFLGIPYAAAPTGHLRFENPRDPSPWMGVLNTTVLPPACPQSGAQWSYIRMHVPGFDHNDEDCLYMNIYVPKTGGDNVSDMAVLVHVHGGSNEVGMAAMFHGDVLAVMGNIIVVTFNYRLGPFGFLNGGNSDFPGNYGLFDQSFALHWVQKNIHFFGGDPSKVTVEGHSAGGGDVGFHIISPKSKGTFRYAIMQSGSPTAFWALVRPPRTLASPTARFSSQLDCPHTTDMGRVKQCLKTIYWENIALEQYQFAAGMFNHAPVIDNVFLSDTPENLIQESDLNGESYMTGLTRDEGSLTAELVVNKMNYFKLTSMFARSFTPPASEAKNSRELSELVVHEYSPWSDPTNITANIIGLSEIVGDSTFVGPAVDVASRLARRNRDIYFYSFEYHSPLSPPPKWLGVPHGRDQFYLFGCPFSGHPLYNYSNEDREVSRVFIEMWSNFVKTGKPSFSSIPAEPIPRFSGEDQLYVKISGYNGSATVAIGSRPRAKQVHFWNSLLPRIRIGQSSDEPMVGTIAWVFIALTGFLFVLVIALIGCVVHYKKKSCDVL